MCKFNFTIEIHTHEISEQLDQYKIYINIRNLDVENKNKLELSLFFKGAHRLLQFNNPPKNTEIYHQEDLGFCTRSEYKELNILSIKDNGDNSKEYTFVMKFYHN